MFRKHGIRLVTTIALVAGAMWSGAPAAASPGHLDARDVTSRPATQITEASMAQAQADALAAARKSATSGQAGAVCYNAHLQNIGWQGTRCNGEVAGTTGENRPMEAIVIAVDTGAVCYNAHLQNIGWQGTRCNAEVAGTTGENRPMEAIAIAVGSGAICYNAHLQNIGWQGTRCNGEVAGTTGENRPMEAIAIAVG